MDEQTFERLRAGLAQPRDEAWWLVKEQLGPLRPTRILEIGVNQGGFSRICCEIVGADGLVVGVDVTSRFLASDLRAYPQYRFILGDSTSADTVAEVRCTSESFDFLFIDGNHAAPAVLSDTENYVPLVRDGGLVVWHDVRLESPRGIKWAWQSVLQPRHFGSFEYFTDPYETGYGLWRKSAESAADLLARAASEYSAGCLDRAAETYRRVLRHDSYCAPALYGLARSLGDTAEASKLYLMAMCAAPENLHHLAAAVAIANVDQVSDLAAILAANLAARNGEVDPKLLLPGARSIARMGLPKCALGLVDKVLGVMPDHIDALLMKLDLLRETDALQHESAAVFLEALGFSAATGRDETAEQLLSVTLPGLIDAMQRLYKYDSVADLIDAVVRLRPDYAPKARAVLTESAALANADFQSQAQRCLALRDSL